MIETKIYLPDKKALAFYREKATPEFWDKHWSGVDLQTTLRKSTDDRLFIPLVKKHLPQKSVVLEGGCGTGHIVHALKYQGFQAIGIDFAEQTIQKVKEAAPELDVRVGDMFALDLPDNALDGYVSVGVIEHFWDGYEEIAREMHRTLKTGGFLFVSFPYMSPLRRLKVALGLYPFQESAAQNDQRERFYQFALNDGTVRADLESLGFQLIEKLTFSGIKGFKDEVALLKPFLQQVYDGKYGWRKRQNLNRLLLPFTSHSALLVMKKIR